ncbi:MAG: hypothetical protein ACXV5F_08420, partial [Halobacteriota archaeon]
GMVRPSLDSPTLYTAVELETALESALKKRETELREMEQRKRVLEELAREQRFRPPDEVSTFKVIKSIRELVSVTTSLVLSAHNGWVIVMPPDMMIISETFGVHEEAKKLIERGGAIKAISDINYADIAPAQRFVDSGEDLRHCSSYKGLYFAVVDQKHCVSAINVDIKRIALDEPISMLFADDAKYAAYLTSTFELLWEQSIPVEERIQQLLQQGPPKG